MPAVQEALERLPLSAIGAAPSQSRLFLFKAVFFWEASQAAKNAAQAYDRRTC
jgi:hypothetical protein